MLTDFNEIYNYKVDSNSLKEYINFKSENPDYIVLFQIGKFYETLFEDAKIFSEVTNTALGSRSFKTKIEICESGVPKDYVNNYIKKLLSSGYKVCQCSEFSDEYGGHYREIVRKYTPGTIMEDYFLERSENNFLLAVNFKDDLYNIAYADVSTGQIYKTKAALKEFKTELDRISPNEIIIPNSQEKIFKSFISKYNTTLIDEKYFAKNTELAIDEYCKQTQIKFKTKLDKIKEYNCASFMALDEMTRKNLELTRTNYLMKKKGSLLWFLNYTKTPMGIRLLKKFLSEPLLSEEKIEQRYDTVEELIKKPELIDEIQTLLEQFSDLSRVCAKLSNTTVLPKDLVNLSRNTAVLSDLTKIVSEIKSKHFKISSSKFKNVLKLANTINQAIKKDCENELKSGNIINENYSAELDFIKSEEKKVLDKIKDYEQSQRKKLKLDCLNIRYIQSVGYCIEIPSKFCLNLPNTFYKKNSTTKLNRYTTEELNSLQKSYASLKLKANELEYEIFKKIRILTSDFVDSIRQLAKEIALIDVMVSFAKSATVNNFTRPQIAKTDIIIKDGYHPSLIKLNNEIIKNDTELKEKSMIILTGANMSGKSTYLKYNALICILAQIGSFVPAKSAKISIVDKIIFRQGSNDDIINNNSSFMVEMNDLKYILENADDKSLILLDEPAKSTNAKESGAIARAFCEYILKNYNSKSIVATHNLELTKLEKQYPERVFNYVIGQGDFEGIIDRKIKRGVISQKYALNTANLADLPKDIINMARQYAL